MKATLSCLDGTEIEVELPDTEEARPAALLGTRLFKLVMQPSGGHGPLYGEIAYYALPAPGG